MKGVRFLLLNVTIVSIMAFVISCSDSSTGSNEPEPEDIPEIVTELFNNQFEIPDDLKVTCMNGESEPDFSNTQTCKVLTWKDYSFWALSFRDNRLSLAFLAVDQDGEIVARLDRDGARYLWKIDLDEEAKTATFIGQAAREIVVQWEELKVE